MWKIVRKITLLSLIATLLVNISLMSVSHEIMGKSNSKITVKDKKAKKAYAKKLGNLHDDTEYGTEWEFALIDLNKDGVSEIVITHDEGYHLEIWAYVKGKVKSVGGGFSGDQKYYPNKKLYYSTTFHASVNIEYYRFNGKKMEELAHIEGNTMGEDTYTYHIGKNKVSKRKWKKYEKKLKKGAKEEKLKFHKNTAANRKKYMK